jgi:hypothetical protein
MFRTRIAAGLIAVGSIAALAPFGWASVFVAWRVADVAANDLLNVRAWPSSQSRVLVGYPNGTVLSMTGRCTGGVRLDEIQRLPGWKQRQVARYQWCEIWLDPHGTGEFRNGWVYGRYIRPA